MDHKGFIDGGDERWHDVGYLNQSHSPFYAVESHKLAFYSPATAPFNAPGSIYPMPSYWNVQRSHNNQNYSMRDTRVMPEYHPYPFNYQYNWNSPLPVTYAQPMVGYSYQAQVSESGFGLFGTGPVEYNCWPPSLASTSEVAVAPTQSSTQTVRRNPIPEARTTASRPRGPPVKPKQSDHALWVGNLPPKTRITALKDYLSTSATNDIVSLFLLSKSDCCFVNYVSQQASSEALIRLHRSVFNGHTLVCRFRKNGENPTGSSAATSPKILTHDMDIPVTPDAESARVKDINDSGPLIVGNSPTSSASSEEMPRKIAEKFFIIKSLTVQDLENSVRTSIWSTQPHNEVVLNQAYRDTEDVYLIFSANKSGEYFGYARMSSIVSQKRFELPASSTLYQTTPSPASRTARKGRIVEDAERGTSFWEVDSSDEDESISSDDDPSKIRHHKDIERSFAVQWKCTVRLPFHLTRGLRNPWKYVSSIPSPCGIVQIVKLKSRGMGLKWNLKWGDAYCNFSTAPHCPDIGVFDSGADRAH